MLPANYDLTIRQGSTWTQYIIWKNSDNNPVNLIDYTARMQVRPVLQSETIIVDLTTENGRITLGGANGTLMLKLEADTTAAIQQSSGVYDLELESFDGTVTAILQGRVKFPREVTR
jgi:hypothetical protein